MFRVISFISKVFCGIHVEANMKVTPQAPINNLIVKAKMVLRFTQLVNNSKQKQETVCHIVKSISHYFSGITDTFLKLFSE